MDLQMFCNGLNMFSFYSKCTFIQRQMSWYLFCTVPTNFMILDVPEIVSEGPFLPSDLKNTNRTFIFRNPSQKYCSLFYHATPRIRALSPLYFRPHSHDFIMVNSYNIIRHQKFTETIENPHNPIQQISIFTHKH